MSLPCVGMCCATSETASSQAMIQRVKDAGGNAVVICDHMGRDPKADIKKMQALIIMGNDFDIDPEHYIHRYEDGDPRKCVHANTKSESICDIAKARADYETELMQLALKKKLPMLCICGGMQRLNVMCGGTLHQHIPDMVGDDRLMQRNQNIPGNVPVIPIIIEPATRMSIIAKNISMKFVKAKEPGMPTVIMENSFRHQSIDMVGKGLQVCAKSDVVKQKDGTYSYLIEAIEATPGGLYGKQFLIGVQWHPEFGASEIGEALVSGLIDQASTYKTS